MRRTKCHFPNAVIQQATAGKRCSNESTKREWKERKKNFCFNMNEELSKEVI